jgi:hypothetical protein
MITTSARTDRAVALAQQAPLPVTVDEDSTLVEDPIEQKRRLRLHSLQASDVNRPADDAFQADGKLDPRQGSIVGKRDQQVKIGVGVLVASRQRAVEHGQTNAGLGPQRTTKPGEQRPMSVEVLALA